MQVARDGVRVNYFTRFATDAKRATRAGGEGKTQEIRALQITAGRGIFAMQIS